VHLDHAFGNREAEAGAALLARVRIVDLLEFAEDLVLVRRRDARAGIIAPSAQIAVLGPAPIATSPTSVNLTALPTRLSSLRHGAVAPAGRQAGAMSAVGPGPFVVAAPVARPPTARHRASHSLRVHASCPASIRQIEYVVDQRQ
jgi:hypothetical protein